MKRVITWISALMMVFQLGIPAHADETKVNYETILGDAFNYGIIADTYEQQNHSQTNFAVKKYGKEGGHVVEVNISGSGDVPFIAGELRSQLRFGQATAGGSQMSYNIATSEVYRDLENTMFTSDSSNALVNVRYYSTDVINQKVDSYINRIKESSSYLASMTPEIEMSDELINCDLNHYTLDLSAFGDNQTVIVNVPSSATKFLDVLKRTDALEIKKNSGTTVVFNIQDSNVRISKYHVTVNGLTINSETSQSDEGDSGRHNIEVDDEIVTKIYWNLYNATYVDLNTTAGLFLVPRSDSNTVITSTSAGWIATGGRVSNTNGELHFSFHHRNRYTPDIPETPGKPDTPVYTSVKVQKVWNDEENSQGMRKDSITVRLYENGNRTEQTVILNDKNGWKASFDNLISDSNISYSVQEENVPAGYISSISENTLNDYTITNTSEKVTVSGTKTWNDNGHEEKRPSSITVRLFADGTETDRRIVTEESNWTYSFEKLPKYSNGKEIKYTVSEDAVDNYTSSINGYDISNTYTPNKTSVTVHKVWNDADNQDGIRSKKVTAELYADGDKVKSAELVATGNWEYTFTDLPKYSNGREIKYTVKEADVSKGYTSEVTGDATTGFTITNTHTSETTSVTVNKNWYDNNDQDGKRPSSITVRLYADGKEVKSHEISADDNWQYEFSALPKFSDGKEIKYTISEDEVTGYTTSIHGYDITNSYEPETTTVPVRKVWDDADNQDGIRSKKVTAELYADGDKVKSAELVATGNWEYTFTDLPKYSNGREINYNVKEANVEEGYTSEVEGDATAGFTITNTHTPETTSVTVNKNWNDNNDQDGKRPSSITVRLLADGKAYTDTEGKEVTATLTADTRWDYTFENLPKKKAGKDIVYTVTEDAVPDYSSSKIEIVEDKETGNTTADITNTHTPGKTSINVSKAWEDSDNQDGIRPESVTVRLYADGEGTDKTVELNDSNKWLATFTDLDEYKDGKKIAYTVAEENVTEGYEATVTGDAVTGYVITNTHAAEMIAVSGTKIWNDNDNQFGRRPESITVRLYADGTETDSRIVTAESNWTYSFDNLPKYSNGKEITYTVQEDAVTDYTASVDGYNITNTFETVRINGQKVWNDNNNAGNTRPESITVQLYANGVQVAETTANKDLDWFFSFGELPVYENGEKITYTVTETPVEGYRSSVSGDAVNGFTVRNTLRPETPTTNDKEPTIDVPNKPTTTTKRRPQTPFTADTSNVALYGGLTLIALATVIGILIRRRES